MDPSERKRAFIERLEASGEQAVRENLVLKRYGNDHIGWATIWLEDKEKDRRDSIQAVQDTFLQSQADAARLAAKAANVQADEAKEANRIAHEANEISREANTKAQRANNLAIVAILVSTVCAIITILVALVATGRA